MTPDIIHFVTSNRTNYVIKGLRWKIGDGTPRLAGRKNMAFHGNIRS